MTKDKSDFSADNKIGNDITWMYIVDMDDITNHYIVETGKYLWNICKCLFVDGTYRKITLRCDMIFSLSAVHTCE